MHNARAADMALPPLSTDDPTPASVTVSICVSGRVPAVHAAQIDGVTLQHLADDPSSQVSTTDHQTVAAYISNGGRVVLVHLVRWPRTLRVPLRDVLLRVVGIPMLAMLEEALAGANGDVGLITGVVVTSVHGEWASCLDILCAIPGPDPIFHTLTESDGKAEGTEGPDYVFVGCTGHVFVHCVSVCDWVRSEEGC